MSLDKLPSISVGSVHLRRDTLDLHVLWRRPDVRLERTAQRLLRLYQGFPFFITRLEICRDRRDRRSCKIFVSCVNFPRKQRSFLHILQVQAHCNVKFLCNC